jgi:hypothetical protein
MQSKYEESRTPTAHRAAMNHMRFECGVDVGALLKTSPKRLVRALWASPDSKDALDIGYMMLTTR